MSALFTQTRLGVFKSITIISVIGAALFLLFLLPEFASADSLPTGVVAERSCGTIQTNIHAYGAGMIQGKVPIVISNQRVSQINIQENCAVVHWNTSVPATSQIIYSKLSKEPVSINLTQPNYGYQNATPQNNSGLAKHVAVLKFLEPGKAYSYRIVTKAYPTALPTISSPQVIIMGGGVSTPTVPATTSSTPHTVVPPTKTVATNTKTNSIAGTLKASATSPLAQSQTKSQTNSVAKKQTADTQKALSVAAAASALDKISKEGSLANKIKGSIAGEETSEHGWSFESMSALMMSGMVLILIAFLGLLFYFRESLMTFVRFIFARVSLLYALGIVALLTIAAAIFAYYYIALVGIALFLSLLAAYLLETVPEDEVNEKQPKLLDMMAAKDILEKESKKNGSSKVNEFNIISQVESTGGYPQKKAKKDSKLD